MCNGDENKDRRRRHAFVSYTCQPSFYEDKQPYVRESRVNAGKHDRSRASGVTAKRSKGEVRPCKQAMRNQQYVRVEVKYFRGTTQHATRDLWRSIKGRFFDGSCW